MKKNKREAIKLIIKKIKNDSYLTYEEISIITGYHTKYLFKLKKSILDGTISLEHGNKNKETKSGRPDKTAGETIFRLKRRGTKG